MLSKINWSLIIWIFGIIALIILYTLWLTTTPFNQFEFLLIFGLTIFDIFIYLAFKQYQKSYKLNYLALYKISSLIAIVGLAMTLIGALGTPTPTFHFATYESWILLTLLLIPLTIIIFKPPKTIRDIIIWLKEIRPNI